MALIAPLGYVGGGMSHKNMMRSPALDHRLASQGLRPLRF
jgi:microcystin-dependent protein